MEKALEQSKNNIVKIVLYGPESTGKTTLAKALAAHYNTLWVPEYAREYLQDKWDNEKKTCEYKDLLPIASGQQQLENNTANKCKELLICDTDILETKVYSEQFYKGKAAPELKEAALKTSYNLYFLLDIDTPWVADDLRDRPHKRKEMFDAFEKALINTNRNYILLSGDVETRMKEAISQIDILLDIHRKS